MIQCRSDECAIAEKHVPPCPIAVIPELTPIKLAEMSQEELDALKESFRNGRLVPLEVADYNDDSLHPDDERFVMSFDLDKLPTAQAVDIVSRLVPEWLGQFLEANARYRKVGNELGYKGILPDVNRKFGVLRARVWDGDEDTGREPTRGIVLDLIGHLFLMLHMMDEEDRLREEAREESKRRHPAHGTESVAETLARVQDEAGDDLDDGPCCIAFMTSGGSDHVPGCQPDGCTVSFAFPDGEKVPCIRGKHQPDTLHFSRRQDTSIVQWDKAGKLR